MGSILIFYDGQSGEDIEWGVKMADMLYCYPDSGVLVNKLVIALFFTIFYSFDTLGIFAV